MRSGLFTTKWSVNGFGAKTMIHRQRFQKQNFIRGRLYSLCGQIEIVLFFELQPRNRIINSDVYCRQMARLNEIVIQKRPELSNHKRIVFHYHNVRSHKCLAIRQKILELGWNVLPHSVLT